jgi:hypothetical protein
MAARYHLEAVGKARLQIRVQGFLWEFRLLVFQGLAHLVLGAGLFLKLGLLLDVPTFGSQFQFVPNVCTVLFLM